MREIIFDTETTGFDAEGADRIVEIGAIELDGLIPTGKSYHTLIDPERDMPAEAAKVHGHTTESLRGQPKFAEIVDDFLGFIGTEANLVAHNAGFDLGFVNAELVRTGRSKLPRARIVDTLALARTKFPGAKLTLDALCNRFGIDLSKRVKHGALLDAELLADVYVELRGGRQRGMALEVAAPARNAAPVISASARTDWPVRHFSITKAEAERHRSFLTALTKPIWDRFPDAP
ncbi:MAG: DNA polymerase III subunit epsilon [Pseudomonadota bacterium]